LQRFQVVAGWVERGLTYHRTLGHIWDGFLGSK